MVGPKKKKKIPWSYSNLTLLPKCEVGRIGPWLNKMLFTQFHNLLWMNIQLFFK